MLIIGEHAVSVQSGTFLACSGDTFLFYVFFFRVEAVPRAIEALAD